MTATNSYQRAATRPEIQALRAVAVVSVVSYHFWPTIAPAGFIGVDVFFVISGFLITGLLLREFDRSGRISLGQFYLRRSRRILPAAFVVLAATAVVTLLFVPPGEGRRFLAEIAASALYIENWHWFADATRPGFADLASTPVQHFWSLSVEEQFYLAWPLLLMGALWIVGRYAGGRRRALVLVLGLVTAASFVHGVLLTLQDNNLAYFSTFSRAWEFGVGAVLACLPVVAGAQWVKVRALVSWVGLAAIGLALWTLTDVETFPGVVALLPVLGTAAVIWAGTPEVRWSTAGMARLIPVQWLGDVSYSLYLWHWPILLMTPFITGVPSEPWVMATLLVLSLVAAGLSKRWIEDSFRNGSVSPEGLASASSRPRHRAEAPSPRPASGPKPTSGVPQAVAR
ncbi:MAG: hypothetical protein JWQ68_840 [Cryobacterium sp.]|nr:hypothetical protein [Cryobacterium sp.]